MSGQAAYTIVKINGEIQWERIPVMHIDQVLWTKDPGIRAEGQLCYDETNLYVHMRTSEDDIRAEYTEPLSPVCNDSCLEFFFMPEGGEYYFNFEINPNGCACIQFGKEERFDIVRENGKEYFDIVTDRTTDGWEVFYKIPLKFIRVFYHDYRFGHDLFANMYKCGNLTVQAHYIAWAPIDLKQPNFHVPPYFRRLSFAE